MQTESRVELKRSEYDIYSTGELDAELEALEPGDAYVDFKNVKYLDSTAIGRLIHRLKALRERNPASTVTFEGVGPRIRRLFEIAGLAGIFKIR